MGKERERGNFPPGTWDKLVRVLKSKPFIGGSKDGLEDQTIREEPEKVVYEVKGNLDAPSFGPLEIPYQAITDLVAKIKKGER